MTMQALQFKEFKLKKLNIFRSNPNEKFRMVPEWLSKAMCYGTKKARAIDYARLNFMLSWYPGDIVSPEALKERAKKDGNKIGNDAAYTTFRNLEKAGHVKKYKQKKDRKGKFLKPSYQLWEEPFGWKKLKPVYEKSETVNDEDKPNDDNNLDNKKNDSPVYEKPETAYNKVRASNNNMSLQYEQQGAASAAAIEIRKLIDPEISFKIDSEIIKSLKDIKPEQIKKASKEAMQSKVRNKAGLFLKIVRSTPLESKLKPAKIPTDATPQQIKFIQCYNSNCEKEVPTCSTIQPNDKGVRNHPAELCKKYCPFVIAYKELFK